MIDETQDFIDSRDVINRIDELERMRDDWNAWNEAPDRDPDDEPEEFTRDDEKELEELTDLQDECNYGDWHYGETLISEDAIESYLDEMVRDCYAIPELPAFMSIEIDYEALKMDYQVVTLRGFDFYIRN